MAELAYNVSHLEYTDLDHHLHDDVDFYILTKNL